jgi:hypothetical protein
MSEEQQQISSQELIQVLKDIADKFNAVESRLNSLEIKQKLQLKVPIESQQPPKLPKEPVQEAPKTIAPVINIHIEIKIVSPPTLPVKSEPTIDLQPNTIPSIPQEKTETPIAPIIVKEENQDKQGSDVSTFQLNGADYPTTVTVSVEPTTFPIVPNVELEVPPTGPGPPARYNLRSKEKGKKDVCCINECKETK